MSVVVLSKWERLIVGLRRWQLMDCRRTMAVAAGSGLDRLLVDMGFDSSSLLLDSTAGCSLLHLIFVVVVGLGYFDVGSCSRSDDFDCESCCVCCCYYYNTDDICHPTCVC